MSTVVKPDSQQPRARRRRVLVAAGLGAAGLLASAYGLGYAVSGNAAPPNTTVGGIDVSGLGRDAAVAAVTNGLNAKLGSPVVLKVGETTYERTPAELGLGVNLEGTVAAVGIGKSLNPVDIVNGLIGGRTLPLVETRDEAKLTAALTALKIDQGAADAKLAFVGIKPEVTPSVEGRALKLQEAVTAVQSGWLAGTPIELPVSATVPDITTEEAIKASDEVAKPAVSGPVSVEVGPAKLAVAPEVIAAQLTFAADGGALKPTLNAEELSKQLADDIAKLGIKAPVDATVRLGADGKPAVVPAQDGQRVTPEALAAAVTSVMTKTDARSAKVELVAAPATFTTADAEKLGIKEVTGQFTTNFPNSGYRWVNIPKAARMLTNVVLKPGESFSMNEALGGQRTVAAGWAEGGGITNGKIVKQVGGALSQVTTTLYNATFFAGMTDIYHKPHSLYFSRYPMGREATISYPDPDMKFKNDTPYGILIQMSVGGRPGTGGSITAKIWSTKYYEVKQTNLRTSNYRQPAPIQDDPSKDCTAQSAMKGFDVDFDRELWRGGKLEKTIHHHWSYNTLTPTRCTYGLPKPTPTPTG